jgi:membrane protease YdiL (CAAX protease family)
MSNLLLFAAILASIGSMWALGVFQTKKIIGPDRLHPQEPPRVLLVAMGFGLMAWAACPLIFSIIHYLIQQNQHKAPTTQLSDTETVLFSGLMELIILATILTTTLLTRPDGLRLIGFNASRIPFGVVLGIAGIAIALPMIFLVNGITEFTLDYFNKTHPAHQLLEVLKSNPPPWLSATDALAAGLLAPMTEEMFFRGLLQTLFRYIFNYSWLAILASATLFAFVHPWYTWPQIFVLGLCLGYAYERTGNLWMSITMHGSFNLLSIWLFTHFN